MFGVTDVQQGTGCSAMLPGGLFELILHLAPRQGVQPPGRAGGEVL
jgi:hypothetical protein